LLVDLGYATMPRLLERVTADQVDAVFISHGHPDHCADLNPLLRARALREDPPTPLPVYAPADAWMRYSPSTAPECWMPPALLR
jgi:ribonuclease BN (tRNA processing enzyme)